MPSSLFAVFALLGKRQVNFFFFFESGLTLMADGPKKSFRPRTKLNQGTFDWQASYKLQIRFIYHTKYDSNVQFIIAK